MEEKLYNECIAMRHQGKPVKKWRFVRRGKQILDDLEPYHIFLFSNHWFQRFQNRYNISLRRKTHCFQKPPTTVEAAIKKFQSSQLRQRNTGKFKVSDLKYGSDAFTICVRRWRNFDKKGIKEVCAQSGQSGLDKRQATVQLIVSADGVDRVKAAVIFRGKGLRISAKEKQSYDRRVKVMYREKAWCGQEIMKEWILTEWANPFKNPIGQNSDGKILIVNVHRAQQTDSVEELLKKRKTTLVHAPPG